MSRASCDLALLAMCDCIPGILLATGPFLPVGIGMARLLLAGGGGFSAGVVEDSPGTGGSGRRC